MIYIFPRPLPGIQEFKDEKYRGRFLQVSVARENFLEKLKREREEAAQQSQAKSAASTSTVPETQPAVALPTLKSTKDDSSSSSSSDDSSSDEETPAKKTATSTSKATNGVKKATKSSSSSSSSSSESEDEDNLILRKKSKAFLENGKIKIDHTVASGSAIHVIEQNPNKSAVKKDLDAKSQKADQKRLQSLNKMKDSYAQQQNAIKQALASVDTAKKSNKIVFSDDEGDSSKSVSKKATGKETAKKAEAPQKKKNLTLFDDDDDEDGGQQDYSKDFAIKEQFQGAKGEKLMRLQSRFQHDSRFKMDARFLDDDAQDDEDGDGEFDGMDVDQGHQTQNGEPEDDERQWQYNILESVMGRKVGQGPPAPSKDSKKK